jgi:hypothetical protein
VAIMGPLVDSGPNLEERVIVPAEIIITCTFCTNIQCGSGTDFSNKTVTRPAGTRENKQTNKHLFRGRSQQHSWPRHFHKVQTVSILYRFQCLRLKCMSYVSKDDIFKIEDAS